MALIDELNKLKYTPTDWTKQYGQITDSALAGLDAAYQAQKAQYEAQLPQIKQSYDAQRGNTYTNARLNALGNNEALAARGLAGNAYQAPMTGYSETSRVSESNALRNALNAAGLQQRQAEEQVQQGITQAGLSRDQQAAGVQNAIQQQMLQAMQQENQFAANYGLQQSAQQEAIRQYNENMALQQQQQAMSAAYQELNAFGRIVTQAAADALGYPVGTTLASLQPKKKSSGKKRATPTEDDLLNALNPKGAGVGSPMGPTDGSDSSITGKGIFDVINVGVNRARELKQAEEAIRRLIGI